MVVEYRATTPFQGIMYPFGEEALMGPWYPHGRHSAWTSSRSSMLLKVKLFSALNSLPEKF